jgi:hypothetical protein
MMRIATEYDRLADMAAERQRSAELLDKKALRGNDQISQMDRER